MCLAQGHNAVTLMRLQPVAPRSRAKHSTTEPMCSHIYMAYASNKGSDRMHNIHKHRLPTVTSTSTDSPQLHIQSMDESGGQLRFLCLLVLPAVKPFQTVCIQIRPDRMHFHLISDENKTLLSHVKRCLAQWGHSTKK